MKILITGISGFVGEYLANAINKKNPQDEIFGLDRTKKKFELFPNLNDRVNVFECDITSKEDVNKVIEKISPDQVYHLAGFASTKSEDRDLVYKVNVDGTKNILDACENLGKKVKILLVSSSHVYGETTQVAKEIDVPKPKNVYGKSKWEMEKLTKETRKNIEVFIARPSNHIGPKQGKGFLVPDKIAEIFSGKVNLLNPKAEKDFSDVRDVVAAYLLIMQKGASSEVYNISSGKIKTVEQIVNYLIKISKRKVEIIELTASGNLAKNIINSSKIRKLGWEPKYKIEETLENTWKYWKEKNKI